MTMMTASIEDLSAGTVTSTVTDDFAELAEGPQHLGQVPEPAPVKEPFCINSRERADWLMGKLSNLDAEEATIDAQYATMKARIAADRKSLEDFFLPQLREWAVGELATQKSKRKSLVLFHGTVAFKKQAAGVTLDKEYIGDYPAEFTETKTELRRGEYLKHAKEQFNQTGELLPGLVPVPESEKFSYTFPKKGQTAGLDADDR